MIDAPQFGSATVTVKLEELAIAPRFQVSAIESLDAPTTARKRAACQACCQADESALGDPEGFCHTAGPDVVPAESATAGLVTAAAPGRWWLRLVLPVTHGLLGVTPRSGGSVWSRPAVCKTINCRGNPPQAFNSVLQHVKIADFLRALVEFRIIVVCKAAIFTKREKPSDILTRERSFPDVAT